MCSEIILKRIETLAGSVQKLFSEYLEISQDKLLFRLGKKFEVNEAGDSLQFKIKETFVESFKDVYQDLLNLLQSDINSEKERNLVIEAAETGIKMLTEMIKNLGDFPVTPVMPSEMLPFVTSVKKLVEYDKIPLSIDLMKLNELVYSKRIESTVENISKTNDYNIGNGVESIYVSSATNNANTWIDEKIEDKDNPAECKCD